MLVVLASTLVIWIANASASSGLRFHGDVLFGRVVKRGYLRSALRFGREVVDSSGQPADGVSVAVLAGNLDGSDMKPVASTITARRGRFAV